MQLVIHIVEKSFFCSKNFESFFTPDIIFIKGNLVFKNERKNDNLLNFVKIWSISINYLYINFITFGGSYDKERHQAHTLLRFSHIFTIYTKSRPNNAFMTILRSTSFWPHVCDFFLFLQQIPDIWSRKIFNRRRKLDYLQMFCNFLSQRIFFSNLIPCRSKAHFGVTRSSLKHLFDHNLRSKAGTLGLAQYRQLQFYSIAPNRK